MPSRAPKPAKQAVELVLSELSARHSAGEKTDPGSNSDDAEKCLERLIEDPRMADVYSELKGKLTVAGWRSLFALVLRSAVSNFAPARNELTRAGELLRDIERDSIKLARTLERLESLMHRAGLVQFTQEMPVRVLHNTWELLYRVLSVEPSSI
jgi:hypothetical protein